ncbi:MAG TPA: hypothetical protein VGD46_11720 [Rhizobacter sp.]
MKPTRTTPQTRAARPEPVPEISPAQPLHERLDALFALDERRQRGELSDAELSEFNTSRDALLAAAGETPLAKALHESLQLVEVLKADGACLDTQQTASAATALLQAGAHRIALFAAMKALQRTPVPAAGTPASGYSDPVAGD